MLGLIEDAVESGWCDGGECGLQLLECGLLGGYSAQGDVGFEGTMVVDGMQTVGQCPGILHQRLYLLRQLGGCQADDVLFFGNNIAVGTNYL